jgi:hypothetical protein
MRWVRFWASKSLGDLLTLCAVVVAWEVSGAAIFGALDMFLDGLSMPLLAAATALLGLPLIYAGAAIFAYVARQWRD